MAWDQARFVADEPSPGADGEVLERLGLHRPYLLHLGTLEPRKGIADLVAAFDRLSGDRPELELILAGGTGWKAGPVMQSVAKARSRERIRRLGYVPDADVPALLRRARAVVYPSLEEVSVFRLSRRWRAAHPSSRPRARPWPSLPATAPCSSRQVSRTRSRRQSRRRSPGTLPVS